jgi:hypothetical protein
LRNGSILNPKKVALIGELKDKHTTLLLIGKLEQKLRIVLINNKLKNTNEFSKDEVKFGS